MKVRRVKIKVGRDNATYTFTTTSKSKAATGMSKSPSQNVRLENIIRSMPAKTAPNLNSDQKWLKIIKDDLIFIDKQHNEIFSPVDNHENEPKANRAPDSTVRQPCPRVGYQAGFEANRYNHILQDTSKFQYELQVQSHNIKLTV